MPSWEVVGVPEACVISKGVVGCPCNLLLCGAWVQPLLACWGGLAVLLLVVPVMVMDK